MVGAVIEPRGRCPLNLYSSTGSRQEANSVDISLQQKSVEHRESILLGAEPCWRHWEGSQDRDAHNKMEEQGEGLGEAFGLESTACKGPRPKGAWCVFGRSNNRNQPGRPVSPASGKVIQESGARSGRAFGVPVRSLDVSLREEEALKALNE